MGNIEASVIARLRINQKNKVSLYNSRDLLEGLRFLLV